MMVHSLHHHHSQSYTSFWKRRRYTSLKSSQFLQMYIVLIAQGKESKLFWNVNAYFLKDVASVAHILHNPGLCIMCVPKYVENGLCIMCA